MEFPRQEYWSGLPFPPVDLSDPGIEPASPVSPALQADSLPAELLGKPHKVIRDSFTIEYSSLFYAVVPCCLYILYIIVKVKSLGRI